MILPRLLWLGCLVVSLAACKQKNYELKDGLLARSLDRGRKVEYVYVEPSTGSAPWPVLLYLHGRQDRGKRIGGRAFYEWGVLQSAAQKGYLALAVSLPGYGKSDGPPDFAGPDSQQAVADVIRELRRRPAEIASDRIVVYGVGIGAVAAARIGHTVAGLAGLILVSGSYDLAKSHAEWKSSVDPDARAIAQAYELEAGLSALGFRERSVLDDPQIRAPLLAFNGGKDPFTNPVQTEELVRKLKLKGVDARAVIYPQTGHHVPVDARDLEIEPFLRHVLGR